VHLVVVEYHLAKLKEKAHTGDVAFSAFVEIICVYIGGKTIVINNLNSASVQIQTQLSTMDLV
jgi:hypothetical protein